jgi:hypothetical protein
VNWRQRSDGLHLDLPVRPVGEYAHVFRIEFSAP